MPTSPPYVLDSSSKSSGKTPDGKTVPLAWEMTTQRIYMKTAPGMPWGDDAALAAIAAAKGFYNPSGDEWFRGVWQEAPQVIMDADYTRKQLEGVSGPALLGSGDDGSTELQET